MLSHAAVPRLPPSVKYLILHVPLFRWFHHARDVIKAFEFPPFLARITLKMGDNDWELSDRRLPTNPTPFGVLCRLIDATIPHLPHTQLVVVGLDPCTAPALGFVDETVATLEEEDIDWEWANETNWDTVCATLRSMLEAQVKMAVSARATELNWSEQQMRDAVGNVPLMSCDEWEAEARDYVDWGSYDLPVRGVWQAVC